MMNRKRIVWAGAVAALAIALGCARPESTTSVLVQGENMATAVAAVESAGGSVTHRLGIIDAVAAELTPRQIERLEASPGIRRVASNRMASTAGKKDRKATGRGKKKTTTIEADATESVALEPSTSASFDGDELVFEPMLTEGFEALLQGALEPAHEDGFAQLVEAPSVHELGVTGRGVTVAVLDTGVFSWPELTSDEAFENRVVGHYDAIAGRELEVSFGQLDGLDSDQNGHGTHLTSIAVSRERDDDGHYAGIAPGANLVVVKAFGAGGEGTYADVIRGLDWIVANRDRFGIRIVNLSFSADVRSHYWDDPLNQAVMKAWSSGIVVVASAGNAGPDPMTVGVPGNVPYVVTVGAMTDGYTPTDRSDDRMATFSSAGPTVERFVKPDLVSPGGHVTAMMDMFATVATEHPEYHDGWRYFTMSGTSQAAAVVTGVAALMLEREPGLSPDDVKCRLMAGAHPAVSEEGTLAYSVFQQGAGLVNAYDAVFNTATGCANQGLDVDADLAGRAHFAGPARVDENGSYYIEGLEDESIWTGSFLWSNSILWSNAMLWNDSFLWSNSFLWGNSFLWSNTETFTDSFLWSNSFLWGNSFLWSNSLDERIDSATWVAQE